MEVADFCKPSSAFRTVASNSTIRDFHPGGAFGLGRAVLVLIGGQRAGLDHAFAEYLQRIRHRGDLVALARAINLRLEVAVGQQLHRTLQAADPPQDIAADIAPDEQRGSDQGERAERQHDHGRERNFPARLPGRGLGFGLHAIDQLLHADSKADIEFAGFIENDLAIVDGVQLLLTNLENARLALAQRQQFQRGVSQRLGRGRVGEHFER